MKKFRYVASSLLIPWLTYCIPTIANQNQVAPKQQPSSIFSNSRLGLGLALEFLQADIGLKIQPSHSLRYIQSQHSQTGKHLQVAPCIELGNTFAKDYYIGLLLSWRYSGLKSNARTPILESHFFDHEYRINHYTDVLIKGGYNINPCSMVYALLGTTITKWTHSSIQSRQGRIIGEKFQMDKLSLGLGIGMGFEYRFKKDYAFSFDYCYHLHPAASKSQPVTIRLQGTNTNGDVNKKIDLSFSTIAVRFTKFFSL